MQKLSTPQPPYALFTGLLFFMALWYWGYDGVTFSDDISYLDLGYRFWNGLPFQEVDLFNYRWGTYVLPGFITYIFGFNDHLASLPSLVSYMMTLMLIWKVLTEYLAKNVFVIFFCSSVYLLHFLPKVYPDSLLVFWVALIPVSAIYRHQKPFLAGMIMAAAFFIGFCTKETIILLAPLPILLFIFDTKKDKKPLFYTYFFLCMAVLVIAYLGYFYVKFDDPFLRFRSIEQGHYISPYSFYDKGWTAVAERLTFSPILTFIERTFWIWIVLSVPGLVRAFKHDKDLHLIFALASLCLLVGFWFMTTSLSFYSPLPLNPRHLIILLPILSVNIALEAKRWTNNFFWNRFATLWIAFGGIVSLGLLDWKLAAFYFSFAAVLLFVPVKWKPACMAVLLLFPVLASVAYQRELKHFDHFKNVFTKTIDTCHPEAPLISHEFVVRSIDVLVGEYDSNLPLFSIHELAEKSTAGGLPKTFTLLTYSYAAHAFPEQESLLKEVNDYATRFNYDQTNIYQDKWIKVIQYDHRKDLSTFSNHGELVENETPSRKVDQ
ncbi:glycosyltransferase family 39 protein [Echinicola vietnamensis]|nr:glycosyltransferase family 39 protein [Echinicola vietnamensis]